MEFDPGELLILGAHHPDPMFVRYVKAFRSGDGDVRHQVVFERTPSFPHFVEEASLTRIGARRFFAAGSRVYAVEAAAVSETAACWALCEITDCRSGLDATASGVARSTALARLVADALEKGGYSLADLK